MHDNIKPFLRPAIPKTDTDLENDMEFSNAFADKIAPSYLSDLYKAPFNQSLTLSDEELANLREACVSDSTGLSIIWTQFSRISRISWNVR